MFLISEINALYNKLHPYILSFYHFPHPNKFLHMENIEKEMILTII